MTDPAAFSVPITVGRQRSVAEQVLRVSTMREAQALASYFEQLLLIRSAHIELGDKVRRAVQHTLDRQLILPLLTLMVKELQTVWGMAGVQGRLRIMMGAATLAAFGQAGAGIAALGMAIGVPLWVVAGGGATLADAYLELFQAARLRTSSEIIAPEYRTGATAQGTLCAPDDQQAAPLRS